MGLADALGPLNAAKRRDAQAAGRSDAQTLRRLSVQTADKKLAKSQDPRYSKKTLYVLTDVMDDAMHRYKKFGGKEESELVDRLLREYIAGGFRG